MIPTLPEILTARGWSQGELARRAGVSRLTIYQAYRGKSVSLETVVKIASALGVSLGELSPESAKAIEAVA